MLSDFFGIMANVLTVLNVLFTVLIVFYERKSPSNTWAWLLVLLLIPYFGFIVYLIFGVDGRKHSIFANKELKDAYFLSRAGRYNIDGLSYINAQDGIFSKNGILEDKGKENFDDLLRLNKNAGGAPLTRKGNRIKLFFDGNDKFDEMLKDIKSAKSHIHLLYYIVRNDKLGQKIADALTEKAREGVEIRFMADGMGSRGAGGLLKRLKKSGAETARFLPPSIIRVNFRNHRKICVIDGRIGYVGGLNIGDEYLGGVKKYGFWRDIHMKMTGDAVKELQLRFMLDWNFYAQKAVSLNEKYFPESKITADEIPVQLVSSGPDTAWSGVHYGLCKMITEANKSIYIQTPYFVPDDSVFELLRIAALAGLDVRIIIPGNPDHPFVYWASISYLGELLKAGVKCYEYKKGFIHSKLVVIDSSVSTVGTANMDIRSFRLNFEINAFIYDNATAEALRRQFLKDLEDCAEITLMSYGQRSKITKIRESVSRLLSPLL